MSKQSEHRIHFELAKARLDYDKAPKEKHILAFDFDNIRRVEVKLEIRRLRLLVKPYKLGRALVKYSSNSNWKYHVLFPDARVDREMEEALIIISRAHSGWKYFSLTVGDTTMRVSSKKGGGKPLLVEVDEDD